MAEDEEKMRKMRMRIERDAYSVLLSFKDGATPRQVEQRMDETLGYTYSNKYYQAGVYSMLQILEEHPQVRPSYDGKFKIIANEDNHELVALIAKQKDGRKKNRGNVQKGRRAATSIGHHHRNGFGGLHLRSSPKPSGLRPFTSMAKPAGQKSSYNPPIGARPFSSAGVARPAPSYSGNPGVRVASRTFSFGTTPNTPAVPNKSSAPSLSIQRPLVRPSTATSLSINSTSLVSSSSTVRVTAPSEPFQNSGNMPSIKEFSDKAKNMMLNLYPKSIHLSEMTDRYSQEYNVTVEPLQLFSKSWMMLVKTTFKDWLQVNNGEVSLKDDWFKKYGSALLRSLGRRAPSASPAPPASSAGPVSTLKWDSQAQTLPSSQGFRYQIPVSQPKSPVEVVMQKMKGLTMGARQALRTPEKPPGLVQKTSSQESGSMMEAFFPERAQLVSKITSEATASVSLRKSTISDPINDSRQLRKSTVSDPIYDSRQLRNLKLVEKSDDMKKNVDTALNVPALPHLKKLAKKGVKPPSWSMKVNSQHTTNTAATTITSSNTFNSDAKIFVENSSSSLILTDPLSSIPFPKSQPVRTRPISNFGVSNRLIGRAIADIQKQSDKNLTPRQTDAEHKSLYVVPTHATPTPFKKDKIDSSSSSKEAESEDGWGTPNESVIKAPSRAPSVSGRKLLLPPMSKGAVSKLQSRSRSVSCSKSMNSIDLAINADLPGDDEMW